LNRLNSVNLPVNFLYSLSNNDYLRWITDHRYRQPAARVGNVSGACRRPEPG